MCEPITIGLTASQLMAVSLGVTAVTAGVGYIAQKRQAEAAMTAQENNAKAVRGEAVRAMVAGTGDLQQRNLQEQSSTALKKQAAQMKARSAAATANATSESAGLSVDALMADFDRQYLNYADSQMQQLGFNQDQIGRQREGLQAQAEGRINTVPRQPIPQPSFGMAAMEFGAGAINTFDKFSVRDPLTGKYTLT